jgi:hypothetical protein
LESQHPQFAPYMLPEEKAVCVCGVGGAERKGGGCGVMGRCPLTTQDSFDARLTCCFRRVESRGKKIDSSSMRIPVCSTSPYEKARPSMPPPRSVIPPSPFIPPHPCRFPCPSCPLFDEA